MDSKSREPVSPFKALSPALQDLLLLPVHAFLGLASVFLGTSDPDEKPREAQPAHPMQATCCPENCTMLASLDALQKAVAELSDRVKPIKRPPLKASSAIEQSADRVFIKLGLTDKERALAHLIVHGNSYQSIGFKLHMSERTVKKRAHDLFRKCKVQSRREFYLFIHNIMPTVIDKLLEAQTQAAEAAQERSNEPASIQ